ncbi:hypothetical protein ACHAXT_002777 [Thalassiosira profunda]
MIGPLQDVAGFLDQFLPSPLAFIKRYHFAPPDLPIAGSPDDSSSSNLATFDVLSYNINNVAVRSPGRRQRILRAIFSSGADIILLQETNPAWKDVLREEAAASQFRHRHFHHPGATDRAAGGLAILSRYPLENVKVFDMTKDINGSIFPALTCDVKDWIDAGRLVTIRIANVHLRPPVELDGSAWFDTARKTEPIRIKEVKELLQRSAGGISETAKMPLDIVAGDFNEGDFAGALSYLTSFGYSDALRRFVPKYKETHAWPFLGGWWTLRKRLDHILWHDEEALATTGTGTDERKVKLQCLGCGVLTGYEDGASDHLPVVARFALVKE